MTDLSPRQRTGAVAAPVARARWAPIVVLALVLVAGGVIVTQFLRSAVDYYCNVDEIGERSGCDADRRLRVQGTVDAGALSTRRTASRRSRSRSTTSRMPVALRRAAGRDLQGVHAGRRPRRLVGDTFMGDHIEVKHYNEYEAENAERIAEPSAAAAARTAMLAASLNSRSATPG